MSEKRYISIIRLICSKEYGEIDMTEKLFDNGLLFEFDAMVISCTEAKKGFEIILDRTAFFPEGGGQAADTGVIGSANVSDVQEKNDTVIHYADKAVEAGSSVHCMIDRDKRFRRMQEHTGEHILTGVIHNRFGYNNVGFHLGDQGVRLDLDGVLSKAELRKCELEANKVIARNVRVIVSYPDEKALEALDYRSKTEIAGKVRIVTIEDCDVCACCAPHVPDTGSVGMIKVISSEKYKGGTRIYIVCGLDALDDYNRRLDDIYEVSHLISAKPEKTSDAVAALLNENNAYKYRINEIERTRAAQIISSLKNESRGSFCIFTENMNVNILRSIANEGVKLTDRAFGVFSEKDGGFSYIIVSSGIGLREKSKEINSVLDGRGGGSDLMIQGSVSADKARIEEYFASL